MSLRGTVPLREGWKIFLLTVHADGVSTPGLKAAYGIKFP
jgi:hypothetical protein